MYDPAAAARAPIPVPGVNPVRNRADWEAMRAQVLADPGAFHGRIAVGNLHWLVDVAGRPAWLSRGADGQWAGWDATTAAPVRADLGEDFAPWDRAFNADDAPNFRWFEGGPAR
jgi:acrylyl-CoA reductase (NADPH) / 3-hydroxypropionyl-CoA dehydratase / 3-hydroxypropionyl-CoA synthetase